MLYSSKFRAAWWLRNPHAQTLYAAKVQRAPSINIRTERLTTPDDDFVDLAWCKDNAAENNNGDNSHGYTSKHNPDEEDNSPLVVIFHGLTGSVKSQYVQCLMHELQQSGITAVLMHFRGCSGEPNKTRGSYHSGHTADIAFVIDTLTKRFPHRKIAAAGFSLGGNALLKYLGATTDSPLQFALSVSPPLLLDEGAQRMNHGFSKVYRHILIKQLKNAVRAKHAKYPQLGMDEFDLDSITSFYDFDHQITAPLHGYDSGSHYHQSASSLQDLVKINTPTHILWARDDPFFTERCIPANEQLSEAVDFELTEHGGHVAFISGNVPLRGKNWLCNRACSLLSENLA